MCKVKPQREFVYNHEATSNQDEVKPSDNIKWQVSTRLKAAA